VEAGETEDVDESPHELRVETEDVVVVVYVTPLMSSE